MTFALLHEITCVYFPKVVGLSKNRNKGRVPDGVMQHVLRAALVLSSINTDLP